MNARWHATHPMAKNATLDDRVRWHVAHAKVCNCRPMPPSVVAELKRRQAARRAPSSPTSSR
jgi:hypothetical protein